MVTDEICTTRFMMGIEADWKWKYDEVLNVLWKDSVLLMWM